jgi:hypothetical protein
MELVDGRTLEKLLEQESPLSPARCLEIVGPMLEALAHVHAQGIVHRDLKPGNVMLAGGRRETVKVADFGLALRPSEPRMSKAGQVMGTPLYMSPEQCNAADLDGRSDLYAVGVMLFEMLTGRLPFTGGSFAALAVAHTTEARPRPSAFIGGLPSPLDDVVVRAMATDPAARFASAHDMLDALERAIRPAAPPRPPVADPPDASRRPPPPQPPRFTSPDVGPSPSEPPAVVRQTTPDQRRRRRTLVIGFGLGGAALFAALAVGLGFFGGDGERGAGTASCPSGMVEVQGGEFRMGSTGEAGANYDETPEGGGERIVTLASFCIDQSEVTVQDYAACVAAGNCAAALSDVAWDGKPDAEGNFLGVAVQRQPRRPAGPSGQLRLVGRRRQLLPQGGQAAADRGAVGVRRARPHVWRWVPGCGSRHVREVPVGQLARAVAEPAQRVRARVLRPSREGEGGLEHDVRELGWLPHDGAGGQLPRRRRRAGSRPRRDSSPRPGRERRGVDRRLVLALSTRQVR